MSGPQFDEEALLAKLMLKLRSGDYVEDDNMNKIVNVQTQVDEKMTKAKITLRDKSDREIINMKMASIKGTLDGLFDWIDQCEFEEELLMEFCQYVINEVWEFGVNLHELMGVEEE